MPDTIKYKKYGLLLDPECKEDKPFIEFLSSKRSKKRRHSYSAILRNALKLLMEQEGWPKDSENGDEEMQKMR